MPAAHAQQKLTQVPPPAPLPGSFIDITDLPADSSDTCTLPNDLRFRKEKRNRRSG